MSECKCVDCKECGDQCRATGVIEVCDYCRDEGEL